MDITKYITKVVVSSPTRRNVYRAEKTGILTIAAATATVRVAGLGWEVPVNVYAKSKGNPKDVDDLSVAATMPAGIEANDTAKAAFLAHVASHVQGWSGWADAFDSAYNALREWSDKPKSKVGAGGLDVSGFKAKPATEPQEQEQENGGQ